MKNYEKCSCACPCHYEPIVLPVKERVCNRVFYVEQPIIVPCLTKVVNHYVPRPTYYYTYNQVEENMCHEYKNKD